MCQSNTKKSIIITWKKNSIISCLVGIWIHQLGTHYHSKTWICFYLNHLFCCSGSVLRVVVQPFFMSFPTSNNFSSRIPLFPLRLTSFPVPPEERHSRSMMLSLPICVVCFHIQHFVTQPKSLILVSFKQTSFFHMLTVSSILPSNSYLFSEMTFPIKTRKLKCTTKTCHVDKYSHMTCGPL